MERRKKEAGGPRAQIASNEVEFALTALRRGVRGLRIYAFRCRHTSRTVKTIARVFVQTDLLIVVVSSIVR